MTRKRAEIVSFPFSYGILGLVFLNLVLFGDLLFSGGNRVLSSPQTDLYLHFVAWRQFAFDQLRQGQLPLWNPHYLCGAPFLGNFESALLYPLNWVYLLFPLPIAINFGIILHVFLAGVFTYFWAVRREVHPLAALVSGTIFMWGGAYFLHVFAGHLPNLCTMVWAPLIFLAIDGLLERTSLRTVLLGIFAASMQILAGHPQYVYFTAIIAGIYVALNLYGKKTKVKILGGFLGIYAGASLLTAVQLWTGIEALLECGRNIPLDYHAASSFSFPPENLITLILPEFFGNLAGAPYWGRWFLWEVSLFIGVTAFWLVSAAITGKEKDRNYPLLIAAVCAFIFSLGAFTPIFHIFYSFVPGFNGLRGLSKFAFLFSLFLAVLAGQGLDGFIRGSDKPRRLLGVLLGIGIFLVTVGSFIFLSAPKGLQGVWGTWFSSIGWLKQTFQSWNLAQKEDYLRQTGFHVSYSLWIGGGTCFLLGLFAHLLDKNRKWIYAIAALSIVELFVFSLSNRPTFEMANLQRKFDQIKNVYQKDPGDYRVFGTASASLVTGGYDIWEDEPMVLGRYGRFVCYSQGLSENQLFSVLPIYQRFHPVFGMMRLKYRVFADQEPIQLRAFPFKVLPRMILADQWEVISDSQKILPALFDPKFNPAKKIYLEQEPNLSPMAGKSQGTVEWNELNTDEVEVRADVPKASLLLITDNYCKGWRGEALPESVQNHYQVMPADYFLQAVPLSAGKHHFVLKYLPSAFVLGRWTSILSCLAYLGILLAHLMNKSPLKKKVAP